MMREQILEATLVLACEKGLSGISMSQIAERVQLKKSSIYSHFGSKEEIIRSMYAYFRGKAKEHSGSAVIDYGAPVEGKTMSEVLTAAVEGYRKLNTDPQLLQFYRLITAERTHSAEAAGIMVEETRRMIGATQMLFYAMAAKSIAHFDDVDAAAFSFAMAVHSIMEYELDAQMAGSEAAKGCMERYIIEFSRRYGKD